MRSRACAGSPPSGRGPVRAGSAHGRAEPDCLRRFARCPFRTTIFPSSVASGHCHTPRREWQDAGHESARSGMCCVLHRRAGLTERFDACRESARRWCPLGQSRLPCARSGRCWLHAWGRGRLGPVIHEVDEALRGSCSATPSTAPGLEVVFDAPTKEWAARRNTPTINIYLYDIREDLDRREVGVRQVPTATGRSPSGGRRRAASSSPTSSPPGRSAPRTSTGCCRRCSPASCANDRLPEDVLTGSLAEPAYPDPDGRAAAAEGPRRSPTCGRRSAGSSSRRSTSSSPRRFDTGRVRAAGPPVLHELGLGVERARPATAPPRRARSRATKAPA